MWHPGMDEKTFIRLQDQELRRQFNASRNLNVNLGGLFNMIAEGAKRVWRLFAGRDTTIRRSANVVSPIRNR